jgi:hypothetical protein
MVAAAVSFGAVGSLVGEVFTVACECGFTVREFLSCVWIFGAVWRWAALWFW